MTYKTCLLNNDVLKDVSLKLNVMSMNNIKWSCLYSGMGIIYTMTEKDMKKIKSIYDDKYDLQNVLKDVSFLRCIYKKGRPILSNPPSEIINPGNYMWDFNSFNKEINPSTQSFAMLCLLKYAEIIYPSDKVSSFIMVKNAEIIYNFITTYLKNTDGLFITAQDKSKYTNNEFIIKPIKDDEKLIDQVFVFESFLKLYQMTSNKNLLGLYNVNSNKYIANCHNIFEFISSSKNELYSLSSRDLCLCISSFCRCVEIENDSKYKNEYLNMIISLCAELESRIKITGEIAKDSENYESASLITCFRAASALLEGYKATMICKFNDLSSKITALINDSYDSTISLFVEPNSSKIGMSIRDVSEIIKYLYIRYELNQDETDIDIINNLFDMIFQKYGIVPSVYERNGNLNNMEFSFHESINCVNECLLPPVFMKSFRFNINKPDVVTVSKSFNTNYSLYASYIFMNYLSNSLDKIIPEPVIKDELETIVPQSIVKNESQPIIESEEKISIEVNAEFPAQPKTEEISPQIQESNISPQNNAN